MRWFNAGTRERATEVRPRGREWRERKEYVEEGGGRGGGGPVRGQDKSNSAESRRLDPPAPMVQRR